MISVPLSLVLPWGILDTAQIDTLGIVRLVGWSQQPAWAVEPPPLALDGRALQHTGAYRFSRPDVPPGDGQLVPQAGLVLEYRLTEGFGGDPQPLNSVRVGDQDFPLEARMGFVEPHYGFLLDTEEVLKRDHIYGFGPPNPDADPEVVELLAGIEGSVLDFGCGSGALVRALRARGLDARGLEIDRDPIRQALQPDLAPYITLYAGDFPSPFESGRFDTVVSSEVLEHIPDYAAAIAEMARLTRHKLILTVPDIAAIPLGTRHRLVPWHLLESTHVNFFTQRSLGHALAPHFAKVEFGRMSLCGLNDTSFYVSLVAVCSK